MKANGRWRSAGGWSERSQRRGFPPFHWRFRGQRNGAAGYSSGTAQDVNDTYDHNKIKAVKVMKGELTAVIEPAPEGGFWAICLEIPGANGQGESIEEARQDLEAAIKLLLEDREADISRGLPPDAVRMPLQIG